MRNSRSRTGRALSCAASRGLLSARCVRTRPLIAAACYSRCRAARREVLVPPDARARTAADRGCSLRALLRCEPGGGCSSPGALAHVAADRGILCARQAELLARSSSSLCLALGGLLARQCCALFARLHAALVRAIRCSSQPYARRSSRYSRAARSSTRARREPWLQRWLLLAVQ